jgi:hypothetical protein
VIENMSEEKCIIKPRFSSGTDKMLASKVVDNIPADSYAVSDSDPFPVYSPERPFGED